jgi:diguanylate cyclase (GGDEF)-like protein/PAS domain S-box-containing protein
MATSNHMRTGSDRPGAAARSKSNHRQRCLQILFVHRDLVAVERCLDQLRKVRLLFKSDVAQNAEEMSKRTAAKRYDLIIAEWPSGGSQGAQNATFLPQADNGTSLILVTETLRRDSAMEFAQNSIHDCIEMDRIGLLPMAVQRVLGEKNLREDRDRAESRLRRSKADYRALLDNSAYGMCSCTAHGAVLDVNQVLVNMLGYKSKEDLKSANLAIDIIRDPLVWAQLLQRSLQTGSVDPVEISWERKDGTTVKVRLRARRARGEKTALDGYGIIVEDVTAQRALEDQLRKRAASDGLTGLANYRELVDTLDSEINRSKRTAREFALVFLDLDGLKGINDRFGHQTGSRALCRLASVLRLCCRSIDTAARYGGDEFALVLPETAASAADLVAHRVRQLFENDGEEPKLSVSAGVASYPTDGDAIGPLLQAADKALYAAKNQRSQTAAQAQIVQSRALYAT